MMKLQCNENLSAKNDGIFNVWKLCDRITRALDQNEAYQLKKTFQGHDECCSGYISGCQFASIISCALKGCLSDNDICRLVDYFKTPDMAGVAYGQFLDIVIGEQDELTAGRSKQVLSSHEHRRLSLTLMGIAQALRFRDQVLKPYFEDYDLIARKGGSVTIAYFKRVLYFLGITLQPSEWQLLAKRFGYDHYKFEYEAFVEEIDQLLLYLDTQGPIDRQCDEEVPPKVISVNLAKVQRPEIGKVRLEDILRKNTVYHSCLKPSRQERDLQTLMLRIQGHTWENRIRIREFFEQYDLHGCGWISRSQFIRSMDAIGLSGLHRLPLTDGEARTICDRYQHPTNGNHINWTRFTDDIDEVFTNKNFNNREVVSAPTEAEDLKGSLLQDLAQNVVNCIRTLVEARRVLIRPLFSDFDIHRNRHVSRSQVSEALSMAGIFITDEQRYALEQRYSDDLGFNYVEFLNDVDPLPKDTMDYKDNRKPAQNNKSTHISDDFEHDIVRVLAKVKGQVVRRKLRIIDFMRGFDSLNSFRITKDQFERGLSTASIEVTPNEVCTLTNMFKTPLQETVDYKRFCDTIAEVDYQYNLEKAPLLVPLQHYPSEDGPHNHLSFEERTIASRTLQKLARHADVVSNLSALLQDFDRNRLGLVNRNQLIRALATRDLHTAISNREFEVLCKCFCVEKGYRKEINYRALLTALDYLYVNRENHPF